MRKEELDMTQKQLTRLRVLNKNIDKVIALREGTELLDPCQYPL